MCEVFVFPLPASEVSPPWQLVYVELTGNPGSWDGLGCFIQAAQQLALEACGMADGRMKRPLHISLPCPERVTWTASVLATIDFAWQFKKYCKFPSKIGFEFFFEASMACSGFLFPFEKSN